MTRPKDEPTLAGIQPDDPALAQIREWNAAAYGRRDAKEDT